MAIVVGTDTYISLADAKTYATSNYLSTNATLIAWNALSDGDKEILLKNATKIIDKTPMQGFKSMSTQTLEFPRYFYSDYLREFYSSLLVPQQVKDAECEIALSLVGGVSDRAKLQREGVKSFSLGDLSETYTGVKNQLPFEAIELLKPFMARSVGIC